MRDHYTFEHSRRVAELARATARRLGLAQREVDLITMAARVHDVGKIGIKSSVLMKAGALNEREWREMRSHPTVGARLIARFPSSGPVAGLSCTTARASTARGNRAGRRAIRARWVRACWPRPMPGTR